MASKTNFKFLYAEFDYQPLKAKIDTFGRDRMAYEIVEMKKVFSDCAKNGCPFPRKKRPAPPRRSKVKMNPDRFLEIMEENYGTCNHPGSTYYKLKTRNFTAECEWTDVYTRRNFDL